MQNDLLKEELFKVLRGVSLEIKGSVLFSENDEIIEKEDALAIKDINSNEKHTLEFKGSYSLDVKAYCQKEKIYTSSSDLSFGIFKTIAGMLNSDEGGKLYIGVLEISKKPFDLEEYQIKLQDRMNGIKLKDKKMIIGIENELHEKSWDIDDYISSIHSGISNKIDVDVENFVTINTINFRDKIVCQVTVEDGACYNRDEGWWVTNEKDPSPKYCLRQDNKTVTFDFKEGMKQLSIMNKKVERKKALGFQNNAQITNGELSEN